MDHRFCSSNGGLKVLCGWNRKSVKTHITLTLSASGQLPMKYVLGDVVVIHARDLASPSQINFLENSSIMLSPHTVKDIIVIVSNFVLPSDSHCGLEMPLIKALNGIYMVFLTVPGLHLTVRSEGIMMIMGKKRQNCNAPVKMLIQS